MANPTIKTISKCFKEVKRLTGDLLPDQQINEIIDEVKKRFNLDIKIISGEEEGLLTSLGVQSSFKNLQNYLIVDIGGQSTELITDIDHKLDIQSEDIGVVSMSENYFNENPINIYKEETATNFFNNIFYYINTSKYDHYKKKISTYIYILT